MGKTFDIIEIQNNMLVEQAKNEIRACNAISEHYGLTLSETEITKLALCRKYALKKSERVEFGGGIMPKLIYAFCDSPYINQATYESTLAELQDAFYYFKNETLDKFTDDELIKFMVTVYNGTAHGSMEYLTGTALYELSRDIRDKINSANTDS